MSICITTGKGESVTEMKQLMSELKQFYKHTYSRASISQTNWCSTQTELSICPDFKTYTKITTLRRKDAYENPVLG